MECPPGMSHPSFSVNHSILEAVRPRLKDFHQLLLEPPKVKNHRDSCEHIQIKCLVDWSYEVAGCSCLILLVQTIFSFFSAAFSLVGISVFYQTLVNMSVVLDAVKVLLKRSWQMVQPQNDCVTEGLLPCIVWLCLHWAVFIPHDQKNVMKTTWGVLDPPVGNTRLNVVRLVASLLQSNTHSINTELINLNTLGVILVSTSLLSVTKHEVSSFGLKQRSVLCICFGHFHRYFSFLALHHVTYYMIIFPIKQLCSSGSSSFQSLSWTFCHVCIGVDLQFQLILAWLQNTGFQNNLKTAEQEQ